MLELIFGLYISSWPFILGPSLVGAFISYKRQKLAPLFWSVALALLVIPAVFIIWFLCCFQLSLP